MRVAETVVLLSCNGSQDTAQFGQLLYSASQSEILQYHKREQQKQEIIKGNTTTDSSITTYHLSATSQ